jgi:hypothetical protein
MFWGDQPRLPWGRHQAGDSVVSLVGVVADLVIQRNTPQFRKREHHQQRDARRKPRTEPNRERDFATDQVELRVELARGRDSDPIGSDASIPGELVGTGTLGLSNRARGARCQTLPWVDWKALWPVSCSVSYVA